MNEDIIIYDHPNSNGYYVAGYDPYLKSDEKSLGTVYIIKMNAEGNFSLPLTANE